MTTRSFVGSLKSRTRHSPRRVRELALPDKEVLAARLNELGDDYAAAKALLLHYGNVMTWLDEKIDEIDEGRERRDTSCAA